MTRTLLATLGAVACLVTGCAVVGGGGGTGAWSPFFDDAGTRDTGIVDGWVFVPREPDELGRRPLRFSPHPLDPTIYVEAAATNVTLGEGSPIIADSRGFYSFDAIGPGEYAIEATDTTGAFQPAAGLIEVRPGAITTGLDDPVDPPQVRASEYFRIGRQDLIRYNSVRGAVEWRWAATETVDGRGVYRVIFSPPGSAVTDEFVDLTFSDTGVLLHGNELGWLDPPTPIAPALMSPGSRFDRSATLVEWVEDEEEPPGEPPPGGDGEDDDRPAPEPKRTPVTLVSELSDVDDLVLPAGRFDNCPKFDITIKGEGVDIRWEMWLAFRIGPVKVVKDTVDHQATFMQIGGKTYPE
ncbi:MAG: hypothetical protein GF320_05910 [Armatimonadia bacterium]|nr:hypothetical protein [Armatimonadia bacterium]